MNETKQHNTTAAAFNFRTYAWKRFRQHKAAVVALYVLIGLMLVAVLAPVIANDKPIYCKLHNEHLFPIFTTKNKYILIDNNTNDTIQLQLDIAPWKTMNFESVLWPPIPWYPGKGDSDNRGYKSPGDDQFRTTAVGGSEQLRGLNKHVLGTNASGEDVLAGLIHGTRISLLIGICAMFIASILGLTIGAIAGFYGDHRIRTSWFSVVIFSFGWIPAWFYGFQIRAYQLSDALSDSAFHFLGELVLTALIFLTIVYVFYLISRLFQNTGRIIKIPIDTIISRGIEIFNSIPALILIIALAAIAKQESIIYVVLIIGLTSWTGIARLTRAELLRIREMEYMTAAKALGFSERRQLFVHALRNGIGPALVAISFGIASAILIESGLSFLGIGVPKDVATWGQLLYQGKENFQAWWLVVFPGIAIFVTVTVYNIIGEALRDAFDPRLKK